jgi:hypothetical protein
MRIDGPSESPPPAPPKPQAAQPAVIETASYRAATPTMPADSVAKTDAGDGFWSGLVSWIKTEVAALEPPTSGPGAPANQLGVPPQGSSSGYFAPTKYPVMRAAPEGTFFPPNADKQAASVFAEVTQSGFSNAGIEAFVDGRAANSPYLYGSDKQYYQSLSAEGRAQIAMQELGPQGVTRYLASLQQQIDVGGGGGLNAVDDPSSAFAQFQSGFNALVKDGSISTDDVKALAAEPGVLISGGILENSPIGVTLDLSGTAHLFAGLDPNAARSLATMNLFAGSSYDSADALIAAKVPDANDAANFLYASGSHVLGATGYDNEAGFVAATSTARLQTILGRSMNGETFINGLEQQNPFDSRATTPLTGSAQLIDNIAWEGYDDCGRLPASSKGQQDILMAYYLAQSMLDGSAKGSANFQTLIDADHDGSGVRSALGNLLEAGFPSILNATWPNGGNANVSTSFGHFTEFELAGSYQSSSDGQAIGRQIGNTYGEFYGDVVNAAQSPAGTAALIAKYGPQMFASAPGVRLDIGARQNEVGSAFSLFGSMMHGVNQGLDDIASRTSKHDDVDSSGIEAFGGALATVAGTAILALEPEGALLIAGNALLGGGALGTLVSSFAGVAGHSSGPPSTIDWQTQSDGAAPGLENTPFGKLFDQLSSAAGQYSSADKSAFESSLFGGF